MRVTLSFLAALALLAVAGCSKPPQETRVSGCGGFADAAYLAMSAGDDDDSAGPEDCDYERLYWWYDDEQQRLTVLNTSAWLNCCGNRSVSLQQRQDGRYLLSEVDQPEQLGLRCGCMCDFDFEVTADDIELGVLELVVERTVTDRDDPTEEVWTGSLDLSEVEGEVVVSAEPVGWCE